MARPPGGWARGGEREGGWEGREGGWGAGRGGGRGDAPSPLTHPHQEAMRRLGSGDGGATDKGKGRWSCSVMVEGPQLWKASSEFKVRPSPSQIPVTPSEPHPTLRLHQPKLSTPSDPLPPNPPPLSLPPTTPTLPRSRRSSASNATASRPTAAVSCFTSACFRPSQRPPELTTAPL